MSTKGLRRTTIRASLCYYFQNIETKKSELEIVNYKKRIKEEEKKKKNCSNNAAIRSKVH